MVQMSTAKICLVALLQWFRQDRLLIVKHNAITLCASLLTTFTDCNWGFVPAYLERRRSQGQTNGAEGQQDQQLGSQLAVAAMTGEDGPWLGAKNDQNGKISLRSPKSPRPTELHSPASPRRSPGTPPLDILTLPYAIVDLEPIHLTNLHLLVSAIHFLRSSVLNPLPPWVPPRCLTWQLSLS